MLICYILHQLRMTPIKICVLNAPPTTNHETACELSRSCVDSAKRKKPWRTRHLRKMWVRHTRTRKVKNNAIRSAIARNSEESPDPLIEISIFPMPIALYTSRHHGSAIEESLEFLLLDWGYWPNLWWWYIFYLFFVCFENVNVLQKQNKKQRKYY